jgi:hypothetical protein
MDVGGQRAFRLIVTARARAIGDECGQIGEGHHEILRIHVREAE